MMKKASINKKTLAGIVLIAILVVGVFFSVTMLPSSHEATTAAINASILKGLLYLNSTQASNGEWGVGYYPVASTAMAVFAFENSGHYGWNTTDPLSSPVQKGLNWLLSQGTNVTIGEQTAGNPNTSGSGIGIEWTTDGYPTYETSMALMALIASSAPTNVTLAGPLGVRTYKAIARDIDDFLFAAQTDPIEGDEYAGGWSYGPNFNNSYGGSSDQSNSGWPVFAMAAAELWGITPPAWVLQQLSHWIVFDQDLTGTPATNSYYGSFGYEGKDDILGGVSEAAVGIEELTLVGALSTNSSMIAAEGYINSMWTYSSGWNVNLGALYAMYNVMKSCRSALPPITYISLYNGTNGVQWYNGTNEYADSIIANQESNGAWPDGGWISWAASGDYSPALSTALALLIMEPFVVNIATTYTLTITVQNSATLAPVSGASVTAEGPVTLNGVTGSNGQVVFTKVQAGNYVISVTAGGYFASTPVSVSVTSNTPYTVSIVQQYVPLSIVVTPSSTSTTVGKPVTFTVSVSGGIPPYTLQFYTYYNNQIENGWVTIGSSDQFTVTPTEPGTYYSWVRVTDSTGLNAITFATITISAAAATSAPTTAPSPTATSAPTATPAHTATPAPSATPTPSPSPEIAAWLIGLLIAIIVIILLLILLFVWRRRRKKKTPQQ